MKPHSFALFLVAMAISVSLSFAAGPDSRYALLLDVPPVVEQLPAGAGKGMRHTAAFVDIRARVAASQSRVMAALNDKNYKVAASDGTLVNVVFVRGPKGIEAELAALPGVVRVQILKPYKRLLNTAINLVNGPAAWDLSGGQQNAGLGMRIGIIDTGIDPGHPGMIDTTLPPPSGGKRCAGADCEYTNAKIIAARSYALPSGTSLGFDLPDDYTPRDRVGHGTAVSMIAAGARNTAPIGTLTGVAPRAYLGNYKVFGSPGVNDSTYDDILSAALSDAFNDGMDVVTLSLGLPAEWKPLDTGSTCFQATGSPCDVFAYAVYNAINSGLSVVVAAGNDGESGAYAPTYATIDSPGTVSNAITVGATTNSRALYFGVKVSGDGVPSNLQRINSFVGDGPRAGPNVSGPLRDVSKLGNDGTACVSLGNGSLTGAIAVVGTGNCTFATKVNVAQAAGAIAVVLINGDGNGLFPPTGLQQTTIPLMLIGKDDGAALLTFLAANPNRTGSLDTNLVSTTADPDIITTFSSLGPSIDASLKPELVAPGQNIYTATQKYDPNGDMYDPSGYTAIQGTSFSVPFVAGAIALVQQKNPTWTTAQLKSAVVNTANNDVGDTDAPTQFARAVAMGAGKLDVAQALRTDLTVDPPVLSFGAVTALPLSKGLVFRNSATVVRTLTLTVQPAVSDPNTTFTVNPSSVILQPGATSPSVTVQLAGSSPAPGLYDGALIVTGGAVPLRIPYLYVVGDNVPNNVIPLSNYDFSAAAGSQFGVLSLKVVDRYGLPVPNQSILWEGVSGGGTVQQTSGATDSYGISEATTIQLGAAPGIQVFRATVTGSGLDSLDYYGTAKLPLISNDGIVNAASNQGGAQAPGSYISIYGQGLADSYAVFNTPFLPLSLGGVSVSFSVPPNNKIRAPGKIHFVSSTQVNVEVPWEIAGQSSVDVWLTNGGVTSNIMSGVALQDASPAGFVYTEASSGRVLSAALDAGFKVIGTANQAKRGQYIQIYANGVGLLDHTPPTGEPAPSTEPLARARVLPTVTIGGKSASVIFTGLAPYIVGLYQVNVQVPADSPTGYQPVIISTNGVSSPAFTIPVQ
ncbi:MAG: S8 family serine peptidase [Bryobacteraceae bacterium]